jgi:DNA-directed RNA polymerase subunit omega
MNPVLVKQALEIVLSPQTLVNMISQRVRQLNSGAGGKCRPLVAGAESMAVADIALREIVEGKMSFDLPECAPVVRASGKNRRRPQHWAKVV